MGIARWWCALVVCVMAGRAVWAGEAGAAGVVVGAAGVCGWAAGGRVGDAAGDGEVARGGGAGGGAGCAGRAGVYAGGGGRRGEDEKTVLMPLRLVGAGSLPAGRWPVRVTVRDGERVVEERVVEVNRAAVGVSGVGRALRVVTTAAGGRG